MESGIATGKSYEMIIRRGPLEWGFGSGKESKMVPLLKLNRSQYGKAQSCKASMDLDVIVVSTLHITV